jgi:hypothetical protein
MVLRAIVTRLDPITVQQNLAQSLQVGQANIVVCNATYFLGWGTTQVLINPVRSQNTCLNCIIEMFPILFKRSDGTGILNYSF